MTKNMFALTVLAAVAAPGIANATPASTALRAKTLPHPATIAGENTGETYVVPAIDVDELADESADPANTDTLKYPVGAGVDRAPAVVTHEAYYNHGHAAALPAVPAEASAPAAPEQGARTSD